MQFSLPFDHSRPGTMAGFANDNSSPGLGSAPKGTAGLALSCEMAGEGQPIAVIRPVLADGRSARRCMSRGMDRISSRSGGASDR